ncbi:hypothetical protein [Candidatus Entotheonella palauensis]|uniref:hypothetical protein n=1 Tax=Candidatus Entotheonella palauensis TaxID=93172 RepID=UPI0015C4500F|nr:hypothetical protein [Candidatus Entotheonella palauensis]
MIWIGCLRRAKLSVHRFEASCGAMVDPMSGHRCPVAPEKRRRPLEVERPLRLGLAAPPHEFRTHEPAKRLRADALDACLLSVVLDQAPSARGAHQRGQGSSTPAGKRQRPLHL